MNLSDIELPPNHKFGFFFTAVFVLAGAYFLNEESTSIAYVFLGLAGVFLITASLKADILLPLNKLWMRYGRLLQSCYRCVQSA